MRRYKFQKSLVLSDGKCFCLNLFELLEISRLIRRLHDLEQCMSVNMLSKFDIADSFILVKTPVEPIT